jgi:hypothetical protein
MEIWKWRKAAREGGRGRRRKKKNAGVGAGDPETTAGKKKRTEQKDRTCE